MFDTKNAFFYIGKNNVKTMEFSKHQLYDFGKKKHERQFGNIQYIFMWLFCILIGK